MHIDTSSINIIGTQKIYQHLLQTILQLGSQELGRCGDGSQTFSVKDVFLTQDVGQLTTYHFQWLSLLCDSHSNAGAEERRVARTHRSQLNKTHLDNGESS